MKESINRGAATLSISFHSMLAGDQHYVEPSNSKFTAMKQDQAALRAGLSRNTAYRLEKGDPGIAMGQVLRYLEAIVPGKTLLELLSETDPALASLSAKEQRRRVRELSKRELEEIDF